MFEGGIFDEAPMPEVPPAPEVSGITDKQDSTAVSGLMSPHDDSDDMGDHFAGPPSPMGGMR